MRIARAYVYMMPVGILACQLDDRPATHARAYSLIVRMRVLRRRHDGASLTKGRHDRHAELAAGYLLTVSRPGHAAQDAGAAAILLSLIKVAPG